MKAQIRQLPLFKGRAHSHERSSTNYFPKSHGRTRNIYYPVGLLIAYQFDMSIAISEQRSMNGIHRFFSNFYRSLRVIMMADTIIIC